MGLHSVSAPGGEIVKLDEREYLFYRALADLVVAVESIQSELEELRSELRDLAKELPKVD